MVTSVTQGFVPVGSAVQGTTDCGSRLPQSWAKLNHEPQHADSNAQGVDIDTSCWSSLMAALKRIEDKS